MFAGKIKVAEVVDHSFLVMVAVVVVHSFLIMAEVEEAK
jgi:hypothetical protein